MPVNATDARERHRDAEKSEAHTTIPGGYLAHTRFVATMQANLHHIYNTTSQKQLLQQDAVCPLPAPSLCFENAVRQLRMSFPCLIDLVPNFPMLQCQCGRRVCHALYFVLQSFRFLLANANYRVMMSPKPSSQGPQLP